MISSKRFHGYEEDSNVWQRLGTRTRRFAVGVCPLRNRHLVSREINFRVTSSPNLQPPVLATEKDKGGCINDLREILDRNMADVIKNRCTK